MKKYPKFLVGEIESTELDAPLEYEALAEDIYYDDSKLDTVKDSTDSFRYTLNADFTVPSGRSKIVTDIIDLNSYCLEVNGILEIT